jgi:crossover junction endodeoxyribonuclease RusA
MEQAALIEPLAPPAAPTPAGAEDLRPTHVWRFRVWGKAEPQGSKKGFVDKFGHVRVVDDNKTALNRWRNHVAKSAEATRPPWLEAPSDGAIVLTLVFVRERNDSDFLADGVTLRKGARRFPETSPDGDKLDRAVWDALTGVAFTNDARVVSWSGLKRFAEPGERAHVDIDIGYL